MRGFVDFQHDKTDRPLLQEARFKSTDFDRAVDAIRRIIQKRLGKSFFRYGGEGGLVRFQKQQAGGGVGALLFSGDGDMAVRFNYEPKRSRSVEITSIDLWDKSWNLDFPPADYTMILQGLNAVEMVDTVVSFMRNPKDTNLTEALIQEGKDRVSAEYFAKQAKEEYGDVSSLKRKEIHELADKYEIMIPNVAWGKKVKKGTYDLTWILDGEGAVVKRGEAEQVKPSEAEKQAKAQIEPEDVGELFEDLKDLTTLVAKGFRPSLLILGGAGTGKTYTVMETVKEAGLVDGKDYTVVKGKASTFGLYTTLFLNHDKLIIFDDSDDVFGDNTARNILKAALDSYDERIISWQAKSTYTTAGKSKEEREEKEDEVRELMKAGETEDPETGKAIKLPSSFEFKGRIIFISNLPREKMEDAITSRSLNIDVTLDTNQLISRIRGIMDNIEPDMDRKDKKEVLDTLEEMVEGNEITYLSIRTFVSALEIKKSGIPRWRKLLSYT